MKNYFFAFVFSIQFLTRIPIPVSVKPEKAVAGRALFFFPLAGWLLGSFFYCLWQIMESSGVFTPFTAAVIVITAEIIITGAFHLDGLADTFDAFMSPATTSEEKLSIMKDSRIGVMGAVALVLSLLIKSAFLYEAFSNNAGQVLLIYPVLGRWTQVACYFTSPYIRKGGTGHLFSQGMTGLIFLGSTLWLFPCLLLFFTPFIASFALMILFLACFRAYVHRHIAGITGDILGSATVLSEIVFIAGIVIFVPLLSNTFWFN